MAFDYDGRVFNLVDTPGHEEFAEDTYRTLTAVDSAVMVIDAAKGIEARTRILQLAIDARRQRFPQEKSYVYRPLAGREDENRWNEKSRATVLKNYNQLDMFI